MQVLKEWRDYMIGHKAAVVATVLGCVVGAVLGAIAFYRGWLG